MINRKRITALTVAAVMTLGSLSTAAFAEDTGAYQVDPASIVFGYSNGQPSVTYTEVPQGEGEAYEVTGTATVSSVEAATCEDPEYAWLTATIDGQIYNSSIKFETGVPALGHAYVDVDHYVDVFPTCTEEGSGHIKQVCSRCGAENPVNIPEVLEAYGHEWGESQVRYENLDNVVENDGKLELEDDTKDGTYDEVTYQVCQRINPRDNTPCEEEQIINTESKTIYAKKVTQAVITDAKGIADDIVGMTMEEFREEYPTDLDIELKNCTKDGQYQVTYSTADDKPVSQKWFTVAAHHMEAPVAIEFDTIEDQNQCVVDEETGTVTNNSCYKEITYYEVTHCTAAGCPNKACKTDKNGEHFTCENTDLKEVSRVKKTAAPTGAHIINTTVEQTVKDMQAAGYADYDALKELAKQKSSFIKLSKNTATCTEDGEATVTFLCKICGAEVKDYTLSTEALGHDPALPVGENAVKPTCESTGSYDAVIYCSRCGEELERREGILIPRLKHTNETKVDVNGIGEDDTTTDTNAYIKFTGDKVVDEGDGLYIRELRNASFSGKEGIGYKELINEFGVKACAATNCEKCHNHEVILDGDVTLTIAAISKQSASGEAGSITLTGTYTKADGSAVTENYTVPYFTTMSSYEGRLEKEPLNGLAMGDDGNYHYYVNGEVDKTKNGIVPFNGGEFFVANGDLCKGANGLNQNAEDGKWYFLSNGQIQRGYHGLALYDGEWFYLTNGELDENVNGLVPYNGGTFLFSKGRLVREYSGLWQNFDGKWYFLSLGQVQNYTGVAMYDGAFFYVRAGQLATDYNGTIEYDGATFQVVAGQLYAA